MQKRRDTVGASVKIPQEYLKMIEDVFNKNFKSELQMVSGKKEYFAVFGEIYPDELVLSVSLKNPKTLWTTNCYASVDYPPSQMKAESGKKQSTAQAVELAVGQCVDAIAGFYATFFEEERPVDYDVEYKQDWTAIELDKTTKAYVLINRDNLELESKADEILKAAEEKKSLKKSKKNLH